LSDRIIPQGSPWDRIYGMSFVRQDHKIYGMGFVRQDNRIDFRDRINRML